MIVENGKVSCVEVQYIVLNPSMEDLVKRKEEKSKQKESEDE